MNNFALIETHLAMIKNVLCGGLSTPQKTNPGRKK